MKEVVVKLVELLASSIAHFQTVSTLSKAIAKKTVNPSALDSMISIGENDAHILKVLSFL